MLRRSDIARYRASRAEKRRTTSSIVRYGVDMEVIMTDAASGIATGHRRGASLARQAREVSLLRDAQRDQIRMVDAKLVRNTVDLSLFGRGDRLVCG